MVKILYAATMTLSGNNITVFGTALTAKQATELSIIYCYYNGSSWEVRIITDFVQSAFIEGRMIVDSTITSTDIQHKAINTVNIRDSNVTLAKLENLTSAYVIVGNSSNRPTAVAMTGDVTITNAGVTTVGVDKIDSTNIAGNSISIDNLKVGLKNELVEILLSFDTLEQMNCKVKMPYKCELSYCHIIVVKALSATDSGYIRFQDGSDVDMTASGISGGFYKIPNSCPQGTEYYITFTGNNALAYADKLQITTSKTTPGGKVMLGLYFTRKD
jgi:hypothetical protein